MEYIKLDYESVKGFKELSTEQKELMQRVNKLHTDCVGLDYKEGMEITETWVNERGIVCVRLKNGNWFHYTKDNTWY